MDEKLRARIRDMLLESYKPRLNNNCSCAICGVKNIPLAFHIAEKTIDDAQPFPLGFVPMSGQRDRIKGSFPICINCAPVCKKCGLPKPTKKVLSYVNKMDARRGLGLCQHFHLDVFIENIW